MSRPAPRENKNRKPRILASRAPLQLDSLPVSGAETVLDGERYYRITNVDQMRPFLISVVSPGDLWMFISSNGALTAGRRDPDGAIFPYCTDDKIHDSAGVTGSKTALVVERAGLRSLWKPFSSQYAGVYRLTRNLYKNLRGDKLLFEEVNHDLELTFRYEWGSSERFGLLRSAKLINDSRSNCRVEILDGLVNILPSGSTSSFQLEKSTLLDAYKRNELVPGTSLGLFTLSSIPIDRPEPAESLLATTAWCVGLPEQKTWLRDVDLTQDYLDGEAPQEVRGERGSYLVQSSFDLGSKAQQAWVIAVDSGRTHSDVVLLKKLLRNEQKLVRLARQDQEGGTRELSGMVAAGDGFQKTRRALGDARHYHNVLFNLMRGGVFAEGCGIDKRDLSQFVRSANRNVAVRQKRWLDRLPAELTYRRLIALARQTGDSQLERICLEYLPLSFSRRHGDPSRPWNRFSINSRTSDGGRVLNYEGNWRDMFQNWEALAVSFPEFLPGMICKFANASTADGYNPYRVTRDGFDWEVVEPHDPWSFIGYWGDHQIIYLLKLLELLWAHEPEQLKDLLRRDLFSFANVPYRLVDYKSLVKDPRRTVIFDHEMDVAVRKRAALLGSDGKLICDRSGDPLLVNLSEKLLISILAKLSNFVPGAGIWLNTQRPEWNDANNALVGSGASMVTLCYLRRHLAFLKGVFVEPGSGSIPVSKEVLALFDEMQRVLRLDKPGGITAGNLEEKLRATESSDRFRKTILDQLGAAGSAYRAGLYAKGFSGRHGNLSIAELLAFLDDAVAWMDASIHANRRDDGLFEAYNLVRFSEKKGIAIRRLYPMLEGQVAVLSSGLLKPAECAELLRHLRSSSLYREDQHGYLLYPDRHLPTFLEKNRIQPKLVKASPLLRELANDKNSDLIQIDEEGFGHFNARFRNASDVQRTLEHLADGKYASLVRRHGPAVLELFEDLFDHESFTGRSGTFFAYEGLGSIYWHMVSKLLLATQESFFAAVRSGAPREVLGQLATQYYDIRSGLGDAKDPRNYGAFPMDPYSHTPRHKGASQPGLTGQVKEDILCRWGELGVRVEAGRVRFEPVLLRPEEFLHKPGSFEFCDLNGSARRIRLAANSLGFTYCQVPVIYRQERRGGVRVHFTTGRCAQRSEMRLSARESRELFERTGKISMITVCLG
jgi:hypothetical protein